MFGGVAASVARASVCNPAFPSSPFLNAEAPCHSKPFYNRAFNILVHNAFIISRSLNSTTISSFWHSAMKFSERPGIVPTRPTASRADLSNAALPDDFRMRGSTMSPPGRTRKPTVGGGKADASREGGSQALYRTLAIRDSFRLRSSAVRGRVLPDFTPLTELLIAFAISCGVGGFSVGISVGLTGIFLTTRLFCLMVCGLGVFGGSCFCWMGISSGCEGGSTRGGSWGLASSCASSMLPNATVSSGRASLCLLNRLP